MGEGRADDNFPCAIRVGLEGGLDGLRFEEEIGRGDGDESGGGQLMHCSGQGELTRGRE